MKPGGGSAVDFLHRNACPAAVTLRLDAWTPGRLDAWRRSGGYTASMRQAFEDWDFFLSLLTDGGRIAIVPEPRIRYRTAPASANLRSMERRQELYGELVDRHRPLSERHLREVLLAQQAATTEMLGRWEAVALANPDVPLDEASYGDGGMAAVVRVATARS